SDIELVHLPSDWMVNIVEQIRHKNPFAAGKRGRLREIGRLQTIGRSPREIDPMSPCFQNVVLEITVVQKHEAFLVTLRRKFPKPPEEPGIEFREVVFAQAVPGSALSTASPRLLVERRPDVAIDAANHFMIVAPPVVPKGIVVLDGRLVIGKH